MADALAKPQATVSQHLAKLRMARLVQTRWQGTQVYYRLANDHVRQLIIDRCIIQSTLVLASLPIIKKPAISTDTGRIPAIRER